MEVLSKATADTEKLAQTIATKIAPGAVLALYGDLGSGKTTFARYLATALGFDARVQSPTFIIHRIYKKDGGSIRKIHHLDLYRLHNQQEILETGIEELLTDPDSVVLIEWPEKAENLLPQNTIKIKFTVTEHDERIINVQNLP